MGRSAGVEGDRVGRGFVEGEGRDLAPVYTEESLRGLLEWDAVLGDEHIEGERLPEIGLGHDGAGEVDPELLVMTMSSSPS